MRMILADIVADRPSSSPRAPLLYVGLSSTKRDCVQAKTREQWAMEKNNGQIDDGGGVQVFVETSDDELIVTIRTITDEDLEHMARITRCAPKRALTH